MVNTKEPNFDFSFFCELLAICGSSNYWPSGGIAKITKQWAINSRRHTWWCHDLETLPRHLPFLRVSIGHQCFPSQKASNARFDILFDISPNTLWNKHSSYRLFKTPRCRYDVIIMGIGHHWLTHWGRATHICVGKLTTIGSDNGLSPGRRQAIIWTIAGILLIGPLGTNLSEILIGIQTFSFKKIHLKMSSAKWRPSCLGLNVLR